MERIAQLTAPAALSQFQSAQRDDAALQQAAQDLEAAFLSVMLKEAKFGMTPETMGGGIGEDQFSSFLTEAHSKSLVENGGIGLAEALFHALKGIENVGDT